MKYPKLFKEKAKSVNDILNEGLCLYVKQEPDEVLLFLYDPKKLTNENFKKYKDINDFVFNSIVGCSKMDKHSFYPYKCWAVSYMAAHKGYGILLYDVLLSIAGKKGLMPDRSSVSNAAKKVWEYYFTNRKSEIETKPIDDEDDPLTKPKTDDGFVYEPFKHNDKDIFKRSFIDRVYYLKKPISYKSLEKQHEDFINNKLPNIKGLDKVTFLKKMNPIIVIKFLTAKERGEV